MIYLRRRDWRWEEAATYICTSERMIPWEAEEVEEQNHRPSYTKPPLLQRDSTEEQRRLRWLRRASAERWYLNQSKVRSVSQIIWVRSWLGFFESVTLLFGFVGEKLGTSFFTHRDFRFLRGSDQNKTKKRDFFFANVYVFLPLHSNEFTLLCDFHTFSLFFYFILLFRFSL